MKGCDASDDGVAGGGGAVLECEYAGGFVRVVRRIEDEDENDDEEEGKSVLLGRLIGREVAADGFEQGVHEMEASSEIGVAKAFQGCPEAGGIGALRVGGGNGFGQGAREAADEFGVQVAEGAGEDDGVPDAANGFGRFGRLDESFECVVTGTKRAAQDFEDAAVVQALQHLIGGEQRLGVFEGRILEAGSKFGAGSRGGSSRGDGLGHKGWDSGKH